MNPESAEIVGLHLPNRLHAGTAWSIDEPCRGDIETGGRLAVNSSPSMRQRTSVTSRPLLASELICIITGDAGAQPAFSIANWYAPGATFGIRYRPSVSVSATSAFAPAGPCSVTCARRTGTGEPLTLRTARPVTVTVGA